MYVEANHQLNQISAYNEKDEGFNLLEEDDNILMIKGYANFISVLKDTFDNKDFTRKDKEKSIRDGIEKLAELLLGASFDSYFSTKKPFGFLTPQRYIYNPGEKALPKNFGSVLLIPCKQLKSELLLQREIVNGNRILRADCTEFSSGRIEHSRAAKKRLFSEFLEKLVDAHEKKICLPYLN